jgi:hypothetical protein
MKKLILISLIFITTFLYGQETKPSMQATEQWLEGKLHGRYWQSGDLEFYLDFKIDTLSSSLNVEISKFEYPPNALTIKWITSFSVHLYDVQETDVSSERIRLLMNNAISIEITTIYLKKMNPKDAVLTQISEKTSYQKYVDIPINESTMASADRLQKAFNNLLEYCKNKKPVEAY